MQSVKSDTNLMCIFFLSNSKDLSTSMSSLTCSCWSLSSPKASMIRPVQTNMQRIAVRCFQSNPKNEISKPVINLRNVRFNVVDLLSEVE